MLILLNPFPSSTPPQPDWPFYCPQTTPDYTVTFNIVYGNDGTNYCPQTVPDYTIGVFSTQTNTDYCPQDTANFYNIDFTIVTSTQTNTNYCPQDSTNFYTFNQAP